MVHIFKENELYLKKVTVALFLKFLVIRENNILMDSISTLIKKALKTNLHKNYDQCKYHLGFLLLYAPQLLLLFSWQMIKVMRMVHTRPD